MQLNVCTKSSSGGSRRGPSCLPRKPPRCCSGLCWLLARSRCARLTAGEASPRSLPIRSLISPHEAVISSRGRLRQTQFQHKSRRHPSQTLTRQDGEFGFGHVEPTAVFGCVVPLKSFGQPPRFRGRKGLVQGGWFVGVEIVLHED